MSEPLADFVARMEKSFKNISRNFDELTGLEARLVNAWRKQFENALNSSTIDWPAINRVLSSMEEFELMIMESVKK